MEKLTVEYIEGLERAAMLRLGEKERAELTERVRRLLSGGLFDKALDGPLAEQEPMIQPLPVRNVMREDVVELKAELGELLEFAISTFGEYFEAPPTLE